MPDKRGEHFYGLCLFVAVYASLFAVAGFMLFTSWFSHRVDNAGVTLGRYHRNSPAKTNDYQWDHVVAPNRKYLSEELRILGEGLRWPYADSGLLNCSALQEATDLEFVAAGWTKAVYRAKLRGRDVAIKTVNLNGQDIRACQGREPGGTLAQCYRRAAAKILKELLLLNELNHSNIVQVLGACVPESAGPVAVATELGDPLDTVRLLQLSWEDRLRLALGVSQILHRLAHSPLGSLAMNDFRRQQFVLVNGILKLSDVDDVGVGEPACATDHDCRLLLANRTTPTLAGGVLCQAGRCDGFNERQNIWHAGRHFIRLFVPLTAPAALEPHIHELLAAYAVDLDDTTPSTAQSLGPWNTARILAATQRLVASFVSGEYRDDPIIATAQFERLPDRDLPGLFDYRCARSVSAVGCVRSVFDEEEAAALCSADTSCRAVVLGPEHTWTGRTLAVFKNGYDSPSAKTGYNLLLKKQS